MDAPLRLEPPIPPTAVIPRVGTALRDTAPEWAVMPQRTGSSAAARATETAAADAATAIATPADADLVEQLRYGGTDALGALYDLYGRMAYGLAYRITRDPALAEDAVQDAFLGAWHNARNYSPDRASVKTWLLSIVHHRSVDIVRRRRRPVESLTAETSSPELVREDLWAEVKQRLDRTAVVGALATLPKAQRDAIVMAYFGGLTQVEIAAATGAPLGTVKSRVRAGLETLRRTLQHQGLESFPS